MGLCLSHSRPHSDDSKKPIEAYVGKQVYK
jgi:hypothetical protein